MPVCTPAIYAQPAVKALLADEAAALLPELGGLAGAHGLLLSGADMRPPRTPMLDCWTHLSARSDRRWEGDIRARQDEPLPFADDSMRVVVLAHALEQVSHPVALLDEARRVLAGDGLLAITGFHPASLWTPWLAWKARQGAMPVLSMPARWQLRLRGRGVRVYAVRRFGHSWPLTRSHAGENQAGGGYLLLARKQTNVVTPLRTRNLRAPPSSLTAVSWAPGLQRESA
ncbi:methyltransferase domain-containing protein [Oleiagrimonas sp. C23AA]|uniref:class I SAM-dependent methyltransferase n=1 Tax=Oleiagrimonas sp. C23AA TaxID=2719047 RepID=UPI0014221ABF|nr:methyltransferase domain-containing protein [Oleiagrimonas sp. C23AA]NII10290.1 class I SAM-dependent methyltransferase [Oleiagrimonas sp. C23AA]